MPVPIQGQKHGMTLINCSLQVFGLTILQSMPFEYFFDVGNRSSFIRRVQFSLDRRGSAPLLVITEDCVTDFAPHEYPSIRIDLGKFLSRQAFG